MRFSEMGDKEIINSLDGSRLGVMADADLVIDAEGKIKAFLLRSRFSFFRAKGQEEFRIPWDAVKKVGDDVLLVHYRWRGKYY
jgi:YlmC/YmxH family sporulation protein